MEIPQKSAEFDYLFEFSPESPLHLGADQGQDQPVRGATAKDQDYKESTKKKKFYAEMKTTNKLEKSRQSARECRARKKLRYQYLDDMIAEREKANDTLRDELVKYVGWCQMLDQNKVPEGLQEFLNSEEYQS
eukprot:TRINITY_DN7715_c0_g1_i2.p1 TRINITY_DN7715_c0_g1~~TRINITY_DN7715_c0_g1_i2.p1  ORF type:complete len:133 (-),score=32.73 TRINITY_DN7715_c0_g1_i2:228-626(-)